MSSLRLILLVAFALVAALVVAGFGAELSIFSGGARIALEDDVASSLRAEFTNLLESCHRLVDVTREEPSQESSRQTWEQESRRTHALIRATGAADSRHTALRGHRFSMLIGLQPEQGAWPVLTRNEEGTITTYTKCDGLSARLLSCRMDGMLPGRKPASDCERLRELR